MTDLLPGRATPAGTARFAGRFADRPGHFRSPDGIRLASIGMGTRGGAADRGSDVLYRGAVPLALEAGTNVFDTALSYRMQRSERSLGAALVRAIREERCARDEVYVISKGGYLTADPDFAPSAVEARRYLIDTYLDSGIIDPELDLVDGVHCMAPRFLDDQIDRSRHNLGLETIDLYCIEDPEVQLLSLGPSVFREVLAEAIAGLEKAVRAGRIAAYGLSTWAGLLVPYTERGHLSLAELLELALEVGGADHHLRGICLPYSLGMGEALGLPSQFGPDSRPSSILDAVRDTGTAVFATAPLVRGRAVHRLPRFVRDAMPELRSDAQRTLQFARSASGITTALVGMRQAEHVDENLDVSRFKPAPPHVIAELFRHAITE